MKKMTRRTALKTTAGAGLVLASSCSDPKKGACCPPKLDKATFYKDGVFQKDAALQAYFDMMERFNYPIQDVLRTDAHWTCDFVQNDFLKLGMSGIFWINEANTYGKSGQGLYKGEFKDQKFGYLGHEIFLLPGQMLPEHSHTGGNGEMGPKMEAWHVRYGSVEFFGEYKGEEETLISEMPEEERPWGYGEDKLSQNGSE